MTVYFCNDEAIDLNAISLMGVSVKTGDNPIGFFGTGLKFSIATLLRTGHQVELIRDGVSVPFTARRETIRGEEFDRVMMGEEPLGFTTKLGRTWETWQAYRELRCNCMDESGVIDDKMPEGSFGTVFLVKGEGIEQSHRNRHEIFLSTDEIFADTDVAIHPGRSNHAYYRGVRAHDLSNPALFTYNVTAKSELTEDRTIKHGHSVQTHVGYLVPQIPDEDIIQEILLAPPGSFEKNLSFAAVMRPSDAFMSTVQRMRNNVHVSMSAIKLWEKFADIRNSVVEVPLDAYEEELLEKAFILLARLDCPISRSDFLVVDGMGEGIYGAVRRETILISKRAFDHGETFVASTIYEEWLHRDKQMEDESRDLQNFLFEKLFSTTARLLSLETRRGVARPSTINSADMHLSGAGMKAVLAPATAPVTTKHDADEEIPF